MTVETTILTVLHNNGTYLEPEPALLIDVNATRGGQPIKATQLRAALDALEARRQIVSMPPEEPGEPFRYRITDQGTARLLARQ